MWPAPNHPVTRFPWLSQETTHCVLHRAGSWLWMDFLIQKNIGKSMSVKTDQMYHRRKSKQESQCSLLLQLLLFFFFFRFPWAIEKQCQIQEYQAGKEQGCHLSSVSWQPGTRSNAVTTGEGEHQIPPVSFSVAELPDSSHRSPILKSRLTSARGVSMCF